MTAYDFMVFAKKKTAKYLNDNYGVLFNRPVVWTDFEVKRQNGIQSITLFMFQLPFRRFEMAYDDKHRLYILRTRRESVGKYVFEDGVPVAYTRKGSATHKSREAVKAYADDLFR